MRLQVNELHDIMIIVLVSINTPVCLVLGVLACVVAKQSSLFA